MSYLTNPYRYVSAIPTCSTYPQSITTTAAGTVYGAVIDTDEQHFGEACLSFDGTDDYCQVDGLVPAMHGSLGSITLWMNTPINHEGWAIGFGDENAQSYVAILSANGFISANGTAPSGTKWEGKSVATLDTWHHVALIQDGTAVKFYINNSLVSWDVEIDVTFWIESAQDVVRLGCRNIQNLGNGVFFNGFLQSVCLWDEPISDDVRDYIYNSGTGRPISQLCPAYNSDNIISWYSCESLSNSTLNNNATPTS